MGRIIIWIIGLSLLSITYVAAIHFKADEIELDLKDRSDLVLLKHQIDWAEAHVNGRDIILEGVAPSEGAIRKAEEAVLSVWGVREVKCNCDGATQEQKNNIAIKTSDSASSAKPMAQSNTKEVTEKLPVITGQTTSIQCQENLNKQLHERSIEFRSGSSRITQESLPLLDSLIKTTRTCPSGLIKIAGHTDNVGDEDKNITLSLNRAEAVLNYFIKSGVAENRLKAVGYGDSSPIDDNNTVKGRKRNRRIEFHITP